MLMQYFEHCSINCFLDIVIIIYLNNELYSLWLIIINYMHTFTLSSGKI